MTLQRAKPVLLVVGIGFLIYAIHAAGGPGPMMSAVLRIGWWFPIAFLPTVVAQWLRTFAWSLIFEKDAGRPPMKALWRARLVGEALNYLTFTGPLLGDPAKASFLTSETGCKKSLASVGIDRFLYALASVLFIVVAGCMWLGGLGAVGIVMCCLVIAVSPRLVRRFGHNVSARTAVVVVGIHVLSNVCMALEAAILLKGLGVDATILQSSSVEAIAKGLNGIFFFLPMQIGVAEGGSAMLFQAMQMGAAVGLALGLARRVRSIAWSLWGLALMA
jgi:hypothetical protein